MTRDNAHLREELDQTTREKVQAAEYGLAVLDEKQSLQQQYDELESMYDTAKLDLEHAQGVSAYVLCMHVSVYMQEVSIYALLCEARFDVHETY